LNAKPCASPTARAPTSGSLAISLTLSAIGLVVGEFAVEVEGAGWTSRGTLISDRHTQFILVHENRNALRADTTGELWEDLITNVQENWENDDDEVDDDRRRRLSTQDVSLETATLSELLDGSRVLDVERVMQGDWDLGAREERRLPVPMTPDFQRNLQNAGGTGVLEGCNTSWYDNQMLADSRLWPKIPRSRFLVRDGTFPSTRHLPTDESALRGAFDMESTIFSFSSFSTVRAVAFPELDSADQPLRLRQPFHLQSHQLSAVPRSGSCLAMTKEARARCDDHGNLKQTTLACTVASINRI